MVDALIQEMRELLRKEEKGQEELFLKGNTSLKELKKSGVVIYPVKIQNKSFGFTNQPVVTFSFPPLDDNNKNLFNAGYPIAIFNATTNEVCNAQVLSISDKKAEILLYSEDYPDWIDEKGIGIKRLPDNRSFQMMHGVLQRIGKSENLSTFFNIIYGLKKQNENSISTDEKLDTKTLNQYQADALKKGLLDIPVQIIHGPPGTGKTTTIVALIQEIRKQEKKIIVSAPSNAAVDHLAQQILKSGLKVLRLGNTAKVNEQVWSHTPAGILSQDKYQKKLKRLNIQAEEFRKMARQYKRSFGKAEREQRNLLFKEARSIHGEIKSLTSYYLSQFLDEADVILGTPIGLTDELLKGKKFDIAILDEAGQCIEPLSWLVFEKAERIILAGDYQQLPPTIINKEIAKSELSISVLERAIRKGVHSHFLQIQYRMTPEIANFSSRYFYNNQLQSIAQSVPDSLVFYDTAGAGFSEERNENNHSISNPEELQLVLENHKDWIGNSKKNCVFISPYSGQIELAKNKLKNISISTIDSFQGQEADVIILSLVRSNSEGKIGFLSDYRRMNVALTRARKKLIVIGDSATLCNDQFYKSFIEYTEEIGAYKSVFELIY